MMLETVTTTAAVIILPVVRLPLTGAIVAALVAWGIVHSAGALAAILWWTRDRQRYHLYSAISHVAMVVWFSGALLGGAWEMHWLRVVIAPAVGIVFGIAYQVSATLGLRRRFTTVYPRKDGGLDFVTNVEEPTLRLPRLPRNAA